MPHPSRNLLRAALAVAVTAAYALPLTVGIASQVGHEIDHLVGELRGLESEAAQLVDEAAYATGDGFVHAHGDVAAHAHEGGIGKLLVAAEHTEQQQSEAAVVALELVGHVPAAGIPPVAFIAETTPMFSTPASSASDVSPRPPLPPPRA